MNHISPTDRMPAKYYLSCRYRNFAYAGEPDESIDRAQFAAREINAAKLERACVLLESEQLRRKDISAMLGFSSTSHFCKIYRARCRKTFFLRCIHGTNGIGQLVLGLRHGGNGGSNGRLVYRNGFNRRRDRLKRCGHGRHWPADRFYGKHRRNDCRTND